MAVSDAYANPQELAQALDSLDTSQYPRYSRVLTAATRVFERETGQFFQKDDAVVNRVFIARQWNCLDLTYEGNCPGIAATAGLVVKVDEDDDGSFADETAWASTDYELWPLNADKGPEPRPWERITVPPWSTKSFRVGSRVQVTAIFGWPAVPAAVKEDVIELCGIWLGANPRATGRINELDQVVSTSPIALSLVKRWKQAYMGRVTF